jgi:hypothetical protein
MRGRVRSGRACIRGAQVLRACAAGVGATTCVRGGCAWRSGWVSSVGRVPLAAQRTREGGVRGGRMGDWSTRCLPAVLGRACVDAWAGAVSGDSFRDVAPVAV